jgi:hypothetical protein
MKLLTDGEAALMAGHTEGLAVSGNVPPHHFSLQGGYLATVLGDKLLICSYILWDSALPTNAPISKRCHTG